MRRLLLILAAISLAISLTACGVISFGGYYYENSDMYKIGDGYITDTVKDIEIDWLNGAVDIQRAEGHDIHFEEESNRSLNDNEILRYLLDGNTLKIRYMASGVYTVDDLTKDLTVYLPADMYNSIEVNGVSANVIVGEVACDEFESNTVSGSITATDLGASKISISTVSGAVDLTVTELDCQKVELDSTSGDINVDLGSCVSLEADSISGKVNITANGHLYEAELNTTSGDIICNGGTKMSANTVSGLVQLSPADSFERVEADTTSGDVILYISDNRGCVLDFDTASGDMDSELSATVDGSKYTFGGGGAEISVNTVSGDLRICKTDSEVRGAGRY